MNIMLIDQRIELLNISSKRIFAHSVDGIFVCDLVAHPTIIEMNNSITLYICFMP